MAPDTIRPGDRVRDRDDGDPNDAIVVNQPPLTASEWDVESRDCSLADDNLDYADDAAVVVVCFVDDLVEYSPPFDPTEQTPQSLATLNESGVHYYTFPAPRLAVIESPTTGLLDTEPTIDESEDSDSSPPNAHPQTIDLDPAITPIPNDPEPVDTGPAPALKALQTTLEDEGVAATVEETDTLTVDRLGQTYHIHADGSVEGDGALHTKLETIGTDAT